MRSQGMGSRGVAACRCPLTLGTPAALLRRDPTSPGSQRSTLHGKRGMQLTHRPLRSHPQALQGLDLFGGAPPEERALLDWEERHAGDRIVLLSDVWLDRPDILDRLHTVFAGGWEPGRGMPGRLWQLGSCHSWSEHFAGCCAGEQGRAAPQHAVTASHWSSHARPPARGPTRTRWQSCMPAGFAPSGQRCQATQIDSLNTAVGAGFSQLEQPPSLFVLMGPFQSFDATATAGRYPRLREHFAALGRVINQYPALRVRRQGDALLAGWHAGPLQHAACGAGGLDGARQCLPAWPPAAQLCICCLPALTAWQPQPACCHHRWSVPLLAGQQQVCAGAGTGRRGTGLQPASAGTAAGGSGGAPGGGARRGAGQQSLQVRAAGRWGGWVGGWCWRGQLCGRTDGGCHRRTAAGAGSRSRQPATWLWRWRKPGCFELVTMARQATFPSPAGPTRRRIRHGGSEVVLYRDNLQQRMRGLAILPPPPGDEAPLFEHVCATVLQQSHLCPVPLEYQASRGAPPTQDIVASISGLWGASRAGPCSVRGLGLVYCSGAPPC